MTLLLSALVGGVVGFALGRVRKHTRLADMITLRHPATIVDLADPIKDLEL